MRCQWWPDLPPLDDDRSVGESHFRHDGRTSGPRSQSSRKLITRVDHFHRWMAVFHSGGWRCSTHTNAGCRRGVRFRQRFGHRSNNGCIQHHGRSRSSGWPRTGSAEKRRHRSRHQSGEGIQSLDTQDFQNAIAARQERIANPDPIAQFVYNAIPGLQPQSVESIMSGGAQRQLKIPGITSILPDKYYGLPYGDQAFIASQMGYSDPNTGMANKDPFGINVRSAFGNYGEYVEDRSTELADYLSGDLADKYDVTYDFETGQYVGANAKKANQMTSRLRTEQQFYADQTKKRNQFIQDSFKKQQDKQNQVDTGDIITPTNIVDEVALTGGATTPDPGSITADGFGFDNMSTGPSSSELMNQTMFLL